MTRSDRVCSLVIQRPLIGAIGDRCGKESATLSALTNACRSNAKPEITYNLFENEAKIEEAVDGIVILIG